MTTPPDPSGTPKRKVGRPRKRLLPPDPVRFDPLPDEDIEAAAELVAAVASQAAPAAPALSDRMRQDLRALLVEAGKRRAEALRVYEPLPAQLEFHQSRAKRRINYGSNRSGKTLSGLAELAWAVTGTHPDPDKYPQRDGRVIVVAKDEDKLGEVIWRILGRPGAFKIVFDESLQKWRPYRPAEDGPAGLKARPAPPLIPPRLIKHIAWAKKNKGIPDKVVLANGWEINFYSSKADPFSIQGTTVDIVVFDEEIEHRDWYPEAMPRLVDRDGWFWWSATPQSGTQQLYDLHLAASQSREDGEADPLVEEFFLSIWDNPYLSEKAKRDLVASLDDEDKRVRIDGEFVVAGTLIFDPWFFPKGVHGCAAFPVPADWTRFAAIDPGAQVCAVLFCACPPPKPDASGLDASLFGDFVYAYDELYIKQCDAAKLAARLRESAGTQEFHTFLIDHHGGRLTEIGSGKNPERQYLEAFRKAKIPHFARGGSFVYGSDDLDGGILRVKEYLRVREDGTAKLRVLTGRCPMLVREVQRYQWKVTNGVTGDKPAARNSHMPDVLRYLCMYNQLRFHKPKAKAAHLGGPYASFQAFRKREKARAKQTKGPGITLG